MTVKMLTGRCLCGEARYRVEDAFAYAANCHCRNCQRATGSAFKPFAGIESEKFAIEADAPLFFYGDATTHDAHCSRCGSLLYSRVREGAYIHVTMGTLDEPPSITPSEHIFVTSKAPWHQISDDLPQYAGHVFEGPPLNR
ncbi:GFA family protein [Martelella endophytica]|uniref:Aldehyde-activating protein n=1 Tax=Martelella endophytica TaxID=1486262 RepID=A0A0D5LR40_MAREN|nr:GFA family protein [Martelella endophytica]AJY46385.1 aldehyde-activating protein [Martelella endophytica]